MALLTTALCTVATISQAAHNADGIAPPPKRAFPAPTNLKALPKDLTGEQVDVIMQQWKVSLGIQCSSCHAEGREKIDPNGRPLLNFVDDSKPMKAVARTTYTMSEEVTTRYVAKIGSSGMRVNCGSCHRGQA